MMQMTAELEAHLAYDVEWDQKEHQFVERINELQEIMRMGVGESFNNELHSLKEKLNASTSFGVIISFNFSFKL
jgi:hypothetical protein